MEEFDWLDDENAATFDKRVVEQKMFDNERNKEHEAVFNQGYKEGLNWANENFEDGVSAEEYAMDLD